MKYILILVGSSILFFISSCNRGEQCALKTISLNTYERFEKDTSRALIQLKILRVYPAKSLCTGVEKFANLYIGKLLNGQILYVFEDCKKVSELIYDTTGRNVPLIDTSNISHDMPKQVIIFVPKDFTMPANSKYLLASIGFLTES